jgi:hypothetical protein
MKTLTNFTYTGKKQQIGGIIFDENDRLFVFVTYCPNCRAKVLFTRPEAREFARQYRDEQNKIRTKLVIKLVKQ